MHFTKRHKELKNLSLDERRDWFRSAAKEQLKKFLSSLSDVSIQELISEFPSDEITDILGVLEKDRQRVILSIFKPEIAVKIAQLLLYNKDTAGGMMATEFLAFDENETVDSVITAIRKSPPIESRIFYIYVVDENKIFKGVISIRDLLTKSSGTKIKMFMNKTGVSIPHLMDKEAVGNYFDKYSYLALPVTDDSNRILGVITADDVSRAVREELTEDIIKLSGISAEDLSIAAPISVAVKKRLPWLLINMLLDVIAVSVVAAYQGTLQAAIAIAVLMPIISDMGGNAGFQGLSLVIRDFALGKVPKNAFWKVFKKQSVIGIIMGLALGLEFALLAFLWKWNPYLGIVAGTAMFLNVYIAGLVGGLLPIFFKMIKVDPAVATAPILTTLTDLTGFSIILFLSAQAINYIK